MSILKSLSNAYWIVGGLKKGDKFYYQKMIVKILKLIFLKIKVFLNELKKVIKLETFKNLKQLIKKFFLI